jgi:hypothetical protein
VEGNGILLSSKLPGGGEWHPALKQVAWWRGMATCSQASCLVEGNGILLSSVLPGGGGWHPTLKSTSEMPGDDILL